MKPCFFCQFRFGIGGHTEGRRFLNRVVRRVDADVDVGRVPAVGGVDVARASRRYADQVSQRAKENVVAGSGPRFVEIHLIVGGQVGVEEEVNTMFGDMIDTGQGIGTSDLGACWDAIYDTHTEV